MSTARHQNLKVLVSCQDESAAKAGVLRGGTAPETYLALLERFAAGLDRFGAQWVGFGPNERATDPDHPDGSAPNDDWAQIQGQMIAAGERRA